MNVETRQPRLCMGELCMQYCNAENSMQMHQTGVWLCVQQLDTSCSACSPAVSSKGRISTLRHTLLACATVKWAWSTGMATTMSSLVTGYFFLPAFWAAVAAASLACALCVAASDAARDCAWTDAGRRSSNKAVLSANVAYRTALVIILRNTL